MNNEETIRYALNVFRRTFLEESLIASEGKRFTKYDSPVTATEEIVLRHLLRGDISPLIGKIGPKQDFTSPSEKKEAHRGLYRHFVQVRRPIWPG